MLVYYNVYSQFGERPYRTGYVHGNTAHQYNEPGTQYQLNSLFGDPANGTHRDHNVGNIYIETGSGNIYRITSYGKLVNLDASLRKGEPVELELSDETRHSGTLEVGQPFRYTFGRTGAGVMREIRSIVVVEDSATITTAKDWLEDPDQTDFSLPDQFKSQFATVNR